MKRCVVAIVLLLPLFLGGTARARTYGVQCSCDPPGTFRPPGFDCAALCSGGSSGTVVPGGGLSAQDRFLLGLFGLVVNSMSRQTAADEAEAARQRAARIEAQRREALRQQAERRRFLQEKAQAEAKLKGPAAPDSFELKDDEPPVPPAAPSILKEAQELLRRCTSADDAAAQHLAGG